MIGVEGGRVVEWGVAVGTAEQLGELALTRWAKFGAWVGPPSRCDRSSHPFAVPVFWYSSATQTQAPNPGRGKISFFSMI